MLTIFDFDGTLCDSRVAIIASLEALFTDRTGESPSREVLDTRVSEGRGLTDVLQSLHPKGSGLTGNELADWEQHYRDGYNDVAIEQVKTYEGAEALVRAAARLGEVAVVSMKGQSLLQSSVEAMGLDSHVAAVFGDLSSEQGERPLKPDAALYHDHIAPVFAGVPAGRTLMIGDTPGDLRFARNARLQSVWASYGYGVAEECREVGFDYAANSTAEVLAAVRSFSEGGA